MYFESRNIYFRRISNFSQAFFCSSTFKLRFSYAYLKRVRTHRLEKRRLLYKIPSFSPLKPSRAEKEKEVAKSKSQTCKLEILADGASGQRSDEHPFGVVGLGDEGRAGDGVAVVLDRDGMRSHLPRRELGVEAVVHAAGDFDRQLGRRPAHRHGQLGAAAAVDGDVEFGGLVDRHQLQVAQRQADPARVRHGAHEGAAGHRLAVELDVDHVRLGRLGRETHQATAAADHGHVVRHLALVHADFQLTFARLARVDCRTQISHAMRTKWGLLQCRSLLVRNWNFVEKNASSRLSFLIVKYVSDCQIINFVIITFTLGKMFLLTQVIYLF